MGCCPNPNQKKLSYLLARSRFAPLALISFEAFADPDGTFRATPLVTNTKGATFVGYSQPFPPVMYVEYSLDVPIPGEFRFELGYFNAKYQVNVSPFLPIPPVVIDGTGKQVIIAVPNDGSGPPVSEVEIHCHVGMWSTAP